MFAETISYIFQMKFLLPSTSCLLKLPNFPIESFDDNVNTKQ